jgi:hypothetical protein
MTLSDGTVAEERIVYQNDATRRIHYTKADDQAVTGYLATTYVDDLDDTRCAVCISSMFDVSEAVGRPAAAARFEAVYAAMFDGYRRYLARGSGQSGKVSQPMSPGSG